MGAPAPIPVLGTGPVVRPIFGSRGLRSGPQFCAYAQDGAASGGAFQLYGAPWLRRIIVQILPGKDATLDASGQALHCIWRFPAASDLRLPLSEQGVLREPEWSPGSGPREPVWLEANGGSWRIPRGAQLFFGGGTKGTTWFVDVLEVLDYNLGHPDYFELDTFVVDGTVAPIPIIRPAEHVTVIPLVGSIIVNGTAATTPGAQPEISLAQPLITAGANTLYKTRVAM